MRIEYAQASFTLDSGDGFKIYGIETLAQAGKRSDTLLVLSHGLAGGPNCYQLKQAQRYFNGKGYDVIRFSYYDKAIDARKLKSCTLKIHANDLTTVCNHFRPRYRRLFVAGHSYGGMTMLLANPVATALSFWDSSFAPYESLWKIEASYIPALDMYVLHFESDHLIGKAMYEEARDLTPEVTEGLAARIKLPSQVIIAADDPKRASRIGLYPALSRPKELVEIKGADHSFSVGETAFDLYDAAHAWFERF